MARMLIVSLTLGFALSVHATENSINYKDSSGREWQRWVLTEPHDMGQLLLVVEDPVDHSRVAKGAVTQRVVYRKYFSNARLAQLQTAINGFNHLRDLDEQKHPRRLVLGVPAEFGLRVQPLWTPVRDHWTLDDEKDYSTWFQNNVDQNFLRGTNIDVDCADFAMTVRWAYAHDHLLPVANSLTGSSQLFGHWSGSTAWDGLPTNPDWRKDKRFIAALQYVLTNSYTHSVLNDLYPTELTTNFVNPGSILLILYSSATGHTELINKLGADWDLCPDSNCISVLYGNEPKATTIFKDLAWIVNAKPTTGGFLRWRWPLLVNGQWALTAKSKMPGYSLDQYSFPDMTDDDYKNVALQKLGVLNDPTGLAIAYGYSLLSKLKSRVALTMEGHFFCSLAKCTPSQAIYDQYSTPSRDAQFRVTQSQFLAILPKIDQGDYRWGDFLDEADSQIFADAKITFNDYIMNNHGLSDNMSPDPSVPFMQRWGLSDTDPTQTIWYLSDLWAVAWDERDSLVESAEYLCFPSGGTKPECAATSADVKKLNTSLLDAGLKQLRQDLQARFTKLSVSDQNKVSQWAQAARTNADMCSWNDYSECWIEDFLFSTHNMVDAMSSDPLAPTDKRYGF